MSPCSPGMPQSHVLSNAQVGHRTLVPILARPYGGLAAAITTENPERFFDGQRMESDAKEG